MGIWTATCAKVVGSRRGCIACFIAPGSPAYLRVSHPPPLYEHLSRPRGAPGWHKFPHAWKPCQHNVEAPGCTCVADRRGCSLRVRARARMLSAERAAINGCSASCPPPTMSTVRRPHVGFMHTDRTVQNYILPSSTDLEVQADEASGMCQLQRVFVHPLTCWRLMSDPTRRSLIMNTSMPLRPPYCRPGLTFASGGSGQSEFLPRDGWEDSEATPQAQIASGDGSTAVIQGPSNVPEYSAEQRALFSRMAGVCEKDRFADGTNAARTRTRF